MPGPALCVARSPNDGPEYIWPQEVAKVTIATYTSSWRTDMAQEHGCVCEVCSLASYHSYLCLYTGNELT